MQEEDEGLAEVHQDGTTWLQKEVRLPPPSSSKSPGSPPCTGGDQSTGCDPQVTSLEEVLVGDFQRLSHLRLRLQRAERLAALAKVQLCRKSIWHHHC